MADAIGELVVRITGDASQLAATISEVQGQLSGMQGGFKGANSAADSFINGTKKGASVLEQYKSRMEAAGKSVEQYKGALTKQKETTVQYTKALRDSAITLREKQNAVQSVAKAYKTNTASLKENGENLQYQLKLLDGTVSTNKEHIAGLKTANQTLKRNSEEYRSNSQAIKSMQGQNSQLKNERKTLTAAIRENDAALRTETSAYKNAQAEVKAAAAAYKEAQANVSKSKAAEESHANTLKKAQSAYQEYQDGLAAVERQQRALNMQATGKNLKEIGSGIDTVTKPLQIASAALAAGGVASAKFAIDFEDNFANVKKTVEGTPAELEEVRQGIIALTTTGIDGRNAIPQTTKQLTELAAAGGQLGIKTPNIVEFTETMAQMGTSTNLYGAEGAATLARFMNVTNTSQKDVKNLGSAIVDLGNNFATTESEIATLGLRMGATGNVVGISAQDVLGYATALSSMGVEAEAGGSSVSRIWMNIQSAVSSGGEELATFAKVSGKSSAEFANQWKTDASGAFQAFVKGLSKSEDQVQTLAELGFNNIRDIQALQRLASEKGINLMTEALQRANTAWTENIALQKEADAKAETTAGQIQITKNNLVEAARGIGETFLPTISKASGGIKDFAQDLANMSDEGKERLIDTATGIVAVGAGAKGVVGLTKGIGGFVEALGKMGIAVPALASVAPVALVAASGIAAVTTATVLGVAAHREWYNSNYKFADGLSEINNKAAESTGKIKELNKVQEQVKSLQFIINSPDSSQEQIDDAKAKIEEIKELLADEYELVIKSDNSNLDKVIDTAKKKTQAEARQGSVEAFSAFNEAYETYQNNRERYAQDEKKYNEAIDNAEIYARKKAAITDLDAALKEGAISEHDYYEGMQKIGEDLWQSKFSELDPFAIKRIVNGNFESASNDIEKYKNRIEDLTESEKKLHDAAESAANNNLELLNLSALDKDTEAVQRNLDMIAGIIKNANEMGAELDTSGYAQAASLAMNNLNSLEDAWSQGGQMLDNVVNDYITSSQKFGASAEQTAVGAALIKNGFRDIASAAATNGGLEKVAEQATEVERSLNKLDGNHSINISANGDIMVVDDTCNKIESIDGKNVDIRLNADGNYEVVNELGETVKTFDGTAVNVRVNADGNYEVLNETGEVIAQIDGKTAEVKITADTSEPDNYLPEPKESAVKFNKDSSEPDNYQPDPKEGLVTFKKDSSAVDNYNPPNLQRTVTYSINTVSAAGLPSPHNLAGRAKGDKDFKGGKVVINDQKGIRDPREIVEVNGTGYIFEGRNVVVDLPRHAKIYTAAQREEMMSAANLPHYANGKNNEAWENAKSDRTHVRKTTYSIIPAWEELEWLDEMRKKFASNAEVIKEIEEETVTYTKKMWSENLSTMQYALDMGWTSQEEYYSRLAAYRDENFAPDTEEYQDATLKLHKYSVQQIDDANKASKAYIDLHGSLNDWNEMGKSMGEVWQTVNRRNVQAANDGLITWSEYFDTREEYTKQFLDNYLNYSDNWIDIEKKYHNMSAESNAAAIKRQMNEVENLFASIGKLTEKEYLINIGVKADLQEALYDVVSDSISKWEDDADWYQKQADVYGWDFMNPNDNEINFYGRKYDNYQKMLDGSFWDGTELEGTELNETERQNVLRSMDEMRLELYKATENQYDKQLDEYKNRMDEVEKLLNEKLSALDERWEVEDRAEDKAETLSDIEKYKNAVTIEGREKYQEALDNLKEIEREEQRYALEVENNTIMEQMQADYKALEAEKERILQQTKEANMKIASLVEPLKNNVSSLENNFNNKVDELINTLKSEIGKIKPSITYTQNNTNYINDGTDGKIYQNKVFDQFVVATGG